MATGGGRQPSTDRNRDIIPEKEINILLLGQTGVGKSTFINAFANYLVYNTLDEAMEGEMQVIIPSTFSYTNPETFEQTSIELGDQSSREKANGNGQSDATQCRSYIFPIGDRRLRLIDTPGMGDTRGSEQDNKNFFEILTYISHYEHLNGICILLKPNEERLTISFRLCIKQILRYLHPSVSENIIFIFTNARSTFFMPGSSKKLLQVLLNDHQEKNSVEVPFFKNNTFLLDNEPFQCLALHKHGIKIDDEQMESYRKSWDHAVKEHQRLLNYIVQCPLHALAGTLSLNEAEQLIRKLARPVAEILRIIQRNIQAALGCKQELLDNQENKSRRLYQYDVQIQPFEHPRLVCVSKKCAEIDSSSNDKKKVSYPVCQEICYLDGVMQEATNDPRISQCEVMDRQTEKCTKCDCSWEYHMNTTYHYDTDLVRISSNKDKIGNIDNQYLLSVIDQRISTLQKEQADIEDIYDKLSKFLHINALHPFNEESVQYLRFYIREERIKHEAGFGNDVVIEGLGRIMMNYQDRMENFKKNPGDVLNNDDVFPQLGILHRLPIHGNLFRYSINLIDKMADEAVKRMENPIELPEKAAASNIMRTLNDIVSGRF